MFATRSISEPSTYPSRRRARTTITVTPLAACNNTLLYTIDYSNIQRSRHGHGRTVLTRNYHRIIIIIFDFSLVIPPAWNAPRHRPLGLSRLHRHIARIAVVDPSYRSLTFRTCENSFSTVGTQVCRATSPRRRHCTE